MKKGLIGIVILAFVALVCGTAFAVTFESVDVSIDATLEWTIFDETGLMPEATKDGPTLELPDLMISVGAWEASTEDAYIKYTAEMGTISFENAVDYDIYDLGEGIGEAQGIALGTELASVSLDLVYTANEEYGVGGTYDAGLFSVGAKYNSTEAYGVELVYPMDPVTLTGQYAIGSAYLAKVAYALTGERAFTGDSAVTLQYKVTDAAEISAELVDFPVTDTIMLQLGVTSAENGTGYNGELVTTLVEGVELILAVGSVAGEDFTYSGKIGVSF